MPGCASWSQHDGNDNLAVEAADLSAADGASKAVEASAKHFGPITVLVSVAGMHDAGISTLDTSDEQWTKTFAVNVDAPFRLARALAPAMVDAGGGSIITISSAAGLVDGGGGPAYTASKHAAVSLSKALAVERGRWLHHRLEPARGSPDYATRTRAWSS